MGALGLTRGQIGIGTNKYSGLMDGFAPPAPPHDELIHKVASSSYHPRLDLGPVPFDLPFGLKTTSASLVALIADLLVATERHFHFLIGDSLEVYYHVGAAKGIEVEQFTPVTAVYDYIVKAVFTVYRTKLYNATSDAVLLGS